MKGELISITVEPNHYASVFTLRVQPTHPYAVNVPFVATRTDLISLQTLITTILKGQS